jgi:hypothetical protein
VNPALKCQAVRWVSDEPFPGWIEVNFTDADGHLWRLFDKPPIFTSADLTKNTPYPIDVELACTILSTSRRQDLELITISTLTPWSVTTEDDHSEFTVLPSQLLQGPADIESQQAR